MFQQLKGNAELFQEGKGGHWNISSRSADSSAWRTLFTIPNGKKENGKGKKDSLIFKRLTLHRVLFLLFPFHFFPIHHSLFTT
jgi:hypothetical protein